MSYDAAIGFMGQAMALGMTVHMFNKALNFGDKQYTLHVKAKTKTSAKKHQVKLKRSGHNARIVKKKSKNGKTVYGVYKHKK